MTGKPHKWAKKGDMMDALEMLMAGGIGLILLGTLYHFIRILKYALSDQPLIEERLRRYCRPENKGRRTGTGERDWLGSHAQPAG
jgi:hypothetical protein